MAALDRSFTKTFFKSIVFLMLMSYTVMWMSAQFGGLAKPTGKFQPLEPLAVRIAPISQNYLGEQGAAEVAAIGAEIDQENAAKSAADPEPADPVASDEPTEPVAAMVAEDIDGAKIYNSVCFACHMAGVAGAPKLETAAWEDRIAKGPELLVQNAINGIQGDSGVMPPKGGRLDLSDAEIEATVLWMLDNLE